MYHVLVVNSSQTILQVDMRPTRHERRWGYQPERGQCRGWALPHTTLPALAAAAHSLDSQAGHPRRPGSNILGSQLLLSTDIQYQPPDSIYNFACERSATSTKMRVDTDDFVVVSHEDAAPSPLESAPRYLSEIDDAIEHMSERLWTVNKKIHDNPELGYEEFIAHETLTTFMRSVDGWKVTPSAYGLKTAWVAVWDSGTKGPVVSFNCEMGRSRRHSPR